MAASETSRLFFFTGVCSGFGRAIAEAALVAAPNPPARLLPGSYALRLVGEKPAALRAEIDALRPLTLSIDFD